MKYIKFEKDLFIIKDMRTEDKYSKNHYDCVSYNKNVVDTDFLNIKIVRKSDLKIVFESNKILLFNNKINYF